MSKQQKQSIAPVLSVVQNDHTIYTFALPAIKLVELGSVERFGLDQNGVNRRLNQEHMMEIAQALAERDSSKAVLWMEPIIVDLQHGWDFHDNALFYAPTSKMSVDDGQHRLEALKSGVLNGDEIAKLNFVITGTIGLEYETRLRIFRMQRERKPIDPRLDLAQRQKLRQWDNPLDQEAYSLALVINSDPTSPLRGRIQLEETDHRPRENAGSEGAMINVRGLYATLRTAIGRRSPLFSLPPNRRAEIIMDTIRISADIWSSQWDSTRHILTTARGINGVLMLFVAGINFRSRVGMDFSGKSLRSALTLGKNFDWAVHKARNQSVRQIMDRLDQSIGRGMQEETKRMDAGRTQGATSVSDMAAGQ